MNLSKAEATKRTTPMMQQYLRIKNEYPDVLLFFRLGDFYELFDEQAEEVSRLLNLTLTARHGTPMCGVPHHAAESYIVKLAALGKKVALCEQVSDPSLPGIVQRDVVRVVTPGTVFDDGLVDEKTNRYTASVVYCDGRFALGLCDATTGEFVVSEHSSRLDLEEAIFRASPVEVVVESADINFAEIPVFEHAFHDDASDFLCRHFSVKSLESFGVNKRTLLIQAAALLLSYLCDTQKSGLPHIESFSVANDSEVMFFDEYTIRNLELFKTMRDGKKEGSLVWILDETNTAMGGRMLRQWILHPLTDRANIEKRFDAIDGLHANILLIDELHQVLGNILDVERLIARIGVKTGSPRDLAAIRQSMQKRKAFIGVIAEIKAEFFKDLHKELKSLTKLDGLLTLLENALCDDLPLALRDGGIIRDGYNKELDDLRAISSKGKGFIADLQKREIERTGISTLKVRYNRVFGYYIEVSRAKSGEVPEDYIRKQTLVNAERFITPELKEYEEKVLGADEKSKALEYDLFIALREEVETHTSELRSFARIVASCDALASLSTVARRANYTRPVFVEDENALEIVEGRHPVIEQIDNMRFVPNDTVMDKERQCLVITGPNLGGKSTWLRQTALIVLLAQMGSFVPAKSAKLGIVDRIFTRIGASDHLVKGQSTFMVEMLETAYILRHATSRSLLILDEIGRGTSTYDGVSLAWSLLEYIHDDLRARTLFATHYHELISVAEKLPTAQNLSVTVQEKGDGIVFLYRVGHGGVSKSYGIEVAKLAGLPRSVIDKAVHILRDLEEGVYDEQIKKEVSRGSVDSGQLDIFDQRTHRVLEELGEIDINTITPLEALQRLEALKDLGS
jgi:DNA mismatch repair protein MutS